MPDGAPRAIRLTFSYAAGQFRLDSLRRVAMRALPSHDVAGYENHSGFWVEVRDRTGRVLHRRVLHEPVRFDAEVYPAEAGTEFTRVPLAEAKGSFDVVVPDLPGAQVVTLYGSLPVPGSPDEDERARATRIDAARRGPAREVARFSIAPEEGR
jgi:hypothetical protein